MSKLLDQARRIADRALKLGADDAKVSISRSRGVDLDWRDGQIERLQDQTEQGLGIGLYVNGRFSHHGTCDLRPEAVDRFLQDAIDLTNYLEEDPHRSLPDPKRYEGRENVDLELFDPSYHQVDASTRSTLAAEVEALARSGAESLPLASISSSVSDSHNVSARVHTNGFEGERESSYFTLGVSVTLKEEDGKRPTGSSYSIRRFQNDLRTPDAVVAEAISKAKGKLGAQKIKTGRYPVIVENRALGRLISALLSPLSGPSLQQRRSLWEGKVNTQIASPLLSIYDDPLIPRGLGSTLWDGDGFSIRRRPLIENGVLKTYLINDYYAKKMGVEPTSGGTHNLIWSLGHRSLSQMISEVEEGVLIDRFLGGNSNGTTGEISFGCGGHMIRNGVLAEPLTEVNLSGHIGTLWSGLTEVGCDPYLEGSGNTPSCLFQDVQLSGE